VHAHNWSVDDMLSRVRESMPYITGITVSGGEATVQHEFLLEFFAQVKSDPEFSSLSCFIDSNGFVTREIWDELVPVTDGVMLDLKAFDDVQHRELTGQSNALVLDSIRYLAAIGLLYEVRLMLAPGFNDSDTQLHDVAEWLMQIDPAMRVKINHFHAHGTRAPARDWPEADEARKDRNRAALLSAGVQNLC
jgi:pyruvate formate lyase activating enzyme